MIVGTAGYLLSTTDAIGFLFFGIWPILILILAISYTRSSNQRAVKIIIELGIGGVAAALPILIYHVAHGSLHNFFDDTVMRALHVSRFPYLKEASYFTFQSYGLERVLALGSFATVVNGLYWIALPLTPLMMGIGTLREFRKKHTSASVGAIPMLAVFYALVALLQQIPIYLYYVLPFTVAGLLWLCLPNRKLVRVLSAIAILFSAISLYYHAAQPITRGGDGIVRGDRIQLVQARSLDRCGLWIDAASLGTYADLVQTIKEQSKPTETILVIPNDPELYFLADRRNPFKFWNSAIGIINSEEAEAILRIIKSSPPRLIIISPNDRNNTPNSEIVAGYLRHTYSHIKTVSNFEIYRWP